MSRATPSDSRYVPFTQQAACCVPTCLQVVMYKESIPLLPAEEIGYYLGLTVNPARSNLFWSVRTAETPPPAGYGTQIYEPEYEPNTAFKNMGIPLSLEVKPVSDFSSEAALVQELTATEDANANALLCFNHGALVDDPTMNWGHVVVFDKVIDDQIRIIDSSPDHPKWRMVDPAKLLQAMRMHGVERSAGIWLVTKG